MQVSRIQSTINRRISSISTRVVAESGLRTRRSVIGFSADGHGGHGHGGGGHFGDDAISDHEVESFCLSVSALQKLMASEQVRIEPVRQTFSNQVNHSNVFGFCIKPRF